MAKSTREKPRKPYPDFPLTPHPSGRWCKKIRGKLYYFGTWDGPDAALAKYLDQRDDLQAGRTPRDRTGGVSVRDLCNRFLSAKRQLVDNRELSARTFAVYHATCLRVADFFGRDRALADLRSEDFESLRAHFSIGRGPVALGNQIRNVRILFRYADESGLIETPIRRLVGPTFKEPPKRLLRHARHAAGPKMFEAEELRRIIEAADQPLRAMILLAINGGFGNTDVATLPRKAVNLTTGWVDFPRPKTAVPRRVPLWAETVEALAEALPHRPEPKAPADDALAFITQRGHRWVRIKPVREAKPGGPEWSSVDAVALMFGRLLESLDMKRNGIGFYAVRHTFETIAGESRDQVAVDAIMGHDDGSMASRYRERISDERLRAVVDHVRGWLFATSAQS